MELLKSDVNQWHAKKKWYDSINEIHEKKAQLENMICWAQVEDYEKKAEVAKKFEENQATEIKKVYNKKIFYFVKIKKKNFFLGSAKD